MKNNNNKNDALKYVPSKNIHTLVSRTFVSLTSPTETARIVFSHSPNVRRPISWPIYLPKISRKYLIIRAKIKRGTSVKTTQKFLLAESIKKNRIVTDPYVHNFEL